MGGSHRALNSPGVRGLLDFGANDDLNVNYDLNL